MDFLTPNNIGKLFFGTIIVVALAELVLPLRPLEHRLGPRWLANIGLGVLNILLTRWLLPVTSAMLAGNYGIGLLNNVALSSLAGLIIGVAALDIVNYWMHRFMHVVPVLWRIHRVHHADLDVDFTTGVRHHPFEVLISIGVNTAVIVLLGLPPLAVAAYQAGRAVIDIASHANLRVPAGLDRLVRLIVVTPDMHRIHHSADRPETDSNYTTLFSVWDRLFGSYRQAPALGHKGMILGLEDWRDEAALTISGLVFLPFRPSPGLAPERRETP